MRHLGDITKINGAEIEPVDCITFGSPCQDLSVAGKRAGLDGERSGLFMQAVRVIKEMREATNGLYPTFAVWENVPGAFSSNGGEDFRTVLEELARVKQPNAAIPRPDERWKRAGYIRGGGWSIAWRQLDAQYWGVPQRRKRIALIVDFGGQRAGEILFERESLRGNTAQSCPPWKGVARAPERSFGRGYRGGKIFDARGNGGGEIAPTMTGGHNGNISDYTSVVCEEKAATLKGRADSSPNADGGTTLICESAGFSFGQSAKARSIGYEDERSPTLLGGGGGNQRPCVIYGIGSYGSNAWKSDNPHSGIYEAETARTLDAFGSGSPAKNQGGIAVCEQIEAYGLSRAAFNQGAGAHYGTGAEAELSPPMVAQGPSAVCEAVYPINDMVATRGAEETRTCLGIGGAADPQFTLQAAHSHAVAYAVDCRNGNINPHINGTLQAKANGGQSLNCQNTVMCRATAQANAETLQEQSPCLNCDHEQPIIYTRTRRWTVRRLTPLECERLQGYPDGWTDIGEWTDSRGKKRKPANTPRYKALGNSIALPQWWWITCKMAAYLPEHAGLGSLFDGIGGFPLVWETRHGKGTAKWASEIEEFCIAVTKARFNDG